MSRSHISVPRLRIALVFSALFVATTASAQVWNETGDAGDEVATAQSTVGTGTLTQITGTLSSPNDVDIYCMQLGPAVEVVNYPMLALQCVVNLGPNIWVFDANGVGVAMNETCQFGVKQLTNNLIPTSGPLTTYIAVSYYGVQPFTAAGSIWQTGIPGERAPDGTDPSGALVGWLGAGNVQPSNPYTINVGGPGVITGYCESPVTTESATWGAVKVWFQ